MERPQVEVTAESFQDFFEQLECLDPTDFEKRLAIAAVDNLFSRSALRLNNFAYAIRELLREILGRLAPDEEVRRCEWFKGYGADEEGVARKDRIRYVVQGGMSNWAAEHILKVESDAYSTRLVKVVESLSKYTHVSAATFDADEQTIGGIAKECIDSLLEFVAEMAACRQSLSEHIRPVCDHHVLNQFLHNTHPQLDELSTHHWIDEYYIENATIVELASSWVIVEVDGNVGVGMQFGSGSDNRNDNGAQMSESWPFTAQIRVELVKPLGSRSELLQFFIDTSGWYGDE